MQYKKLAPNWDFFSKWRQNHNNEYYISCFNEQVLNELNLNEVVNMLNIMANGKDIALICYEKPSDFCHRHLVAEWLENNGYPCREWEE